MNKVVWFFDLYAQHRDNNNRAQNANGEDVGLGTQLVIYVCCFIGILIGPFLVKAAGGAFPDPVQVFGSWNRMIWSIPIALILTAALFKTVLSAKTMLVVQMGSAVAVGVASVEGLPLALAALGK